MTLRPQHLLDHLEFTYENWIFWRCSQKRNNEEFVPIIHDLLFGKTHWGKKRIVWEFSDFLNFQIFGFFFSFFFLNFLIFRTSKLLSISRITIKEIKLKNFYIFWISIFFVRMSLFIRTNFPDKIVILRQCVTFNPRGFTYLKILNALKGSYAHWYLKPRKFFHLKTWLVKLTKNPFISIRHPNDA